MESRRTSMLPAAMLAPSTSGIVHGVLSDGASFSNGSALLRASPDPQVLNSCGTLGMELISQEVECIQEATAVEGILRSTNQYYDHHDMECLRVATAVERALLAAERQWLQMLNADVANLLSSDNAFPPWLSRLPQT